MNEYEHEPVRGLPAELPKGEHVVWRGEPRWTTMALRVFHVRKVAIYFVLIALVQVAVTTGDGMSLAAALQGTGWLALLGAGAIALLAGLAWLYARTTVYTLTNRRLVMRFGVAIPMMVNIPWDRVDAAELKRYAGGDGDIMLSLGEGQKMSYWLLWPHAKPWHFAPVNPSLRCLANVEDVADRLAEIVGTGKAAVVTARDPGRRAAEPATHTAAMSRG